MTALEELSNIEKDILNPVNVIMTDADSQDDDIQKKIDKALKNVDQLKDFIYINYPDNYLLLTSDEEVTEYFNKIFELGEVAIDTETNGLVYLLHNVVGISMYHPELGPCYIPIDHKPLGVDPKTVNADINLVRELMYEFTLRTQDGRLKAMFHNGKFDLSRIRATFDFGPFEYIKPYWDTLLGSKLLNENAEEHGLKYLFLKQVVKMKDPRANKKFFKFSELFDSIPYGQFNPKDVFYYAGFDAVMTWKLQKFQAPYLDLNLDLREDMVSVAEQFHNVEMDVIEAVTFMEDVGFLVDTEKNKLAIENVQEEVRTVESKLTEFMATCGYLHRFNEKIFDIIEVGFDAQIKIQKNKDKVNYSAIKKYERAKKLLPIYYSVGQERMDFARKGITGTKRVMNKLKKELDLQYGVGRYNIKDHANIKDIYCEQIQRSIDNYNKNNKKKFEKGEIEVEIPEYSTDVTLLAQETYEFLKDIVEVDDDAYALVRKKYIEYKEKEERFKVGEFSWKSTAEVGIALFDILELNNFNSQKPRSTGKDILKTMRDNYPDYYDLIDQILVYRKQTKLLDGFLMKLHEFINPVDGRVHTTLNQLGTVTTRFSSKEPNMQQFPKGKSVVRQQFIASKGHVLIGSDFSQQEPRILTYMSNDESLLQAYNEGRDLYATIGSLVYGVPYEHCLESYVPGGKDRRNAMKLVTLAVMYGMTNRTLAGALKVTEDEATDIMESLFERMPRIAEFKRETEEFVQETGYVKMLGGAKRRLPDVHLPDYEVKVLKDKDGKYPKISMSEATKMVNQFKRTYGFEARKELNDEFKKTKSAYVKNNYSSIQRAIRQGVNAKIQGSGANMTKMGISKIYYNERMREMGVRLLVTVHDEILVEAPLRHALEAGELLSGLMIEAGKELVPTVPQKCDVEYQLSWGGEDMSEILEGFKKGKYNLDFEEFSDMVFEFRDEKQLINEVQSYET